MTYEEIKKLTHKEMDILQNELWELISNNQVDKVKIFLKDFAIDESFYAPTFDEEQEPLFNAAHCLEKAALAYEQSGNFDMLECLFRYGLKASDNDGFRNVLQYYCDGGGRDERLIAYLLAKGATFEAVGKDGLNILHHWAYKQEAEKLALAHHFGADMESKSAVKGCEGQTPLMYAAKSDVAPIGKAMAMLIKLGANIHALDSQNRSVLDVALESNKSILQGKG